jgi:hypothetical protein
LLKSGLPFQAQGLKRIVLFDVPLRGLNLAVKSLWVHDHVVKLRPTQVSQKILKFQIRWNLISARGQAQGECC